MQLLWLSSDLIQIARDALLAARWDSRAHFTPEFHPPPAPPGIGADDWPRIAEVVARAERVSAFIRSHGLESSIAEFGDSPHAVEVATLITAAATTDAVTVSLLEALFRCPVDDLIAYGDFLKLLADASDHSPDRAITAYERFCDGVRAMSSDRRMWPARAAGARDGLASLYIRHGRFDDGDRLFSARHAEDRADVAVALTASRSFLAAGAIKRAIDWLGRGAERARDLGRPRMESQLRIKQTTLRRRLPD